jgi:tRNA nucleotidyltransferase/poly(A) polymerase
MVSGDMSSVKVPRKKGPPASFPEAFRGVEKRILADPLIQQVLGLARQEKVPLFLVGGTIRDILLGRKIKDYDFVVKEMEMSFLDQLGELLKASVFPMGKGRQEGIYRLVKGERVIDCAAMEGDDIMQDLLRRDFTINAIAYSFAEGRFSHAPQAIEDLKAGRIDLVSPQALKADPLRMLRAIRYRCTLPGFALTERLKEEIKRHKALLTGVAPERIRAELDDIILSPCPGRGLRLMHELRLLTSVFPETAPLEDLPQGRYHRTDALSHTIEVVDAVDTLIREERPFPIQPSRDDRLMVGYAALFHDLGKPATKSIDAEGEIHFYGHPQYSSLLAQGIMNRLRFPSKVRDGVIPLVENHMRILTLAQGGPTDKALRRLIHVMGEGIRLLLVLGLAETGSKEGDETEERERFMDLCQRIWGLYETEDLIAPEPLLMGRDLLELGHSPGPRLGEILAEVRRRQIAGELRDREEALRFVEKLYPP